MMSSISFLGVKAVSINKVAILIKKAALEFDKISNPFFAQYDLSAAQFKVLKLIYMQESRPGG